VELGKIVITFIIDRDCPALVGRYPHRATKVLPVMFLTTAGCEHAAARKRVQLFAQASLVPP
jgi:hypothetical protein